MECLKILHLLYFLLFFLHKILLYTKWLLLFFYFISFIRTNSFFPVSLLTTTICFFSRSFGPSSSRKGTPFSSHSLYLNPGVYSSLSSKCTLYSFNFFSISSHFFTTSFLVLSNKIGIITICIGAMRGGRMRPLSSPCIRIIMPILLVVIPHEFCHTYCFSPFSSKKVMSNAFAKFCPRQ